MNPVDDQALLPSELRFGAFPSVQVLQTPPINGLMQPAFFDHFESALGHPQLLRSMLQPQSQLPAMPTSNNEFLRQPHMQQQRQQPQVAPRATPLQQSHHDVIPWLGIESHWQLPLAAGQSGAAGFGSAASAPPSLHAVTPIASAAAVTLPSASAASGGSGPTSANGLPSLALSAAADPFIPGFNFHQLAGNGARPIPESVMLAAAMSRTSTASAGKPAPVRTLPSSPIRAGVAAAPIVGVLGSQSMLADQGLPPSSSLYMAQQSSSSSSSSSSASSSSSSASSSMTFSTMTMGGLIMSPTKQHYAQNTVVSDTQSFAGQDAAASEVDSSPPRADKSSNVLYKTELCHSFQSTNYCKYKDKCQFAHGAHELRNVLRHPKYKTNLCRSFQAIGSCPYGHRCHFVHEAPSKTADESFGNSDAQFEQYSSFTGSLLFDPWAV
ncbi:hypothetical protein CAOG_08261 [Capsaspora owczarzaki ATCC 30864]|uniref:C3H1-type domain-containing protein n=1 Tax=Capsaspora owczarzaki (strain ATCC 30864) TaxID=595528 RepID=A0A0D2W1R0_CAPO3|nr:hypothetical protein CAOG_08261 [Capsaspora owczarzaki ATCC 30864]KJE98272.1 hypothetical protein CAOG_008261 [Capsaspora owczarzaki ATCC 30864]|eukprot:XP_004342430.1 hypothetical protein CAOG_08261 [Capsaspora owczarzaki ATCC 30864]